jgi:phosphoribosyl-AMP cyclohydrolase
MRLLWGNGLFISARHLQKPLKVVRADDVDFAKRGGVIPVIVQDKKTKDVLTLVYANRDALENTIKTGNAWFWSTSRNKLWMKGEESGNVQPVHEILTDCDSDALLYIVDSEKPMCHTGERTCFHNVLK